jgi:hypothetical protein
MPCPPASKRSTSTASHTEGVEAVAAATHLEAQQVWAAIRPRDFDELISAAICGYEVRDEWLQWCCKLYLLGLVAGDVFK